MCICDKQARLTYLRGVNVLVLLTSMMTTDFSIQRWCVVDGESVLKSVKMDKNKIRIYKQTSFFLIHLVWAWFRKTTVWVFCFEIKIVFFYFPTFRAWKIDQTRNFEARDFILLLNERLNCLLKPQCAEKWTFIRILSCNPWRHRPTRARVLKPKIALLPPDI